MGLVHLGPLNTPQPNLDTETVPRPAAASCHLRASDDLEAIEAILKSSHQADVDS